MTQEIEVSSPHARYVLEKRISSDAYSATCYGRVADTGDRVCIRIVSRSNIPNQDVMSMYEKEAQLLKRFCHPNIVHLIDSFVDGDLFCIVTEYYSKTTLEQAMNNESKIAEEKLKHIFKQIFEVLAFLHDLRIAYNALKPENILIGPHADIKLINFCYASEAGFPIRAAAFNIKPPEVIENSKYSAYLCDMFQAGVILYRCYTKKNPWTNLEQSMLLEEMKMTELEKPAEIPVTCWSLIEHLLAFDQCKRYSTDQALNHFWVKSKKDFGMRSKVTSMLQRSKINSPTLDHNSGTFSPSSSPRENRSETFTIQLSDTTSSSFGGRGSTTSISVVMNPIKVGSLHSQSASNKFRQAALSSIKTISSPTLAQSHKIYNNTKISTIIE